MSLQQFTATFSAPGFYELETIHAVDLTAAETRAEEIRIGEPYAGWPSIQYRRNNMTVTVRPANAPSGCPVLSLDGVLLRRPEAAE